ncbi:MAG: hypothetical protein A2306_03170 [Omnitrophica WOR_2 bacterium RIFOXYB2_FULL_38_16]|nr:MAG: hypothetical protein A2Y06_03175 [Omnitrophica WOR_2 bacterium GWA2_37_7]OGX50383.1 MAG: hypothetical protein A2243_02230 [Omnitrophica WOR_2 bacterium RIFOXYA2_FULL_38_17]OGX59226.1 MAG: hypothetical protein A2306_03170 [Omnitrophica WOR_2 bacterium RIFOXYB2_FULL_38_16]
MSYLFWVMILAFVLLTCISMTSFEWQNLGARAGKLFMLFFWALVILVVAPCVYIYASHYYKMVIVGGVSFSEFKSMYSDYGWSQMLLLYGEIYNQIGWIIYRMKH